MSKKKYKVVIIGAGPAGLTAAYKLLLSDYPCEVTVIEKTACIGGISRTVVHNGNRMDIGGHRFFSKNADVNIVWNNLMPLQGHPAFDDKKLEREVQLTPGGPDPEKENNCMLFRNRISRIFYNRVFFNYPMKMSLNTLLGIGIFKSMTAGFSYIYAQIFRRQEKSLEDFYINRFGKKLYSMFFEQYTEKVWGRHPSEISADWGKQRVKGLSITAVILDIFRKTFRCFSNECNVETSLIERFRYPKYGPGQFWEKVADEIIKMGGTIVHNCRAEHIKVIDKRITEVVCVTNGERNVFDCDILISSMPLKELTAAMENVPQNIKNIANGLPYRDFITIGILVKKINLKNTTNIKTLNNSVPDCWMYIQDPGVKLGRIQVFNNWSPYIVKDPENTVWLGLEYFCNEEDSFWECTDEELKNFSVSELVKLNILKHDEAILDFHVERVAKAYPAYFGTYSEIDKLKDYLNVISNLYCVGRNGQHRYNNMDHSMATAFAAIKNICEGNWQNKEAVWAVNTEQEYHEQQNSK